MMPSAAALPMLRQKSNGGIASSWEARYTPAVLAYTW